MRSPIPACAGVRSPPRKPRTHDETHARDVPAAARLTPPAPGGTGSREPRSRAALGRAAPRRPAASSRGAASPTDACDQLVRKAFGERAPSTSLSPELRCDPLPKCVAAAASMRRSSRRRRPNSCEPASFAGRITRISQPAAVNTPECAAPAGMDAKLPQPRAEPRLPEALAHAAFENDGNVPARRIDHAMTKRGWNTSRYSRARRLWCASSLRPSPLLFDRHHYPLRR